MLHRAETEGGFQWEAELANFKRAGLVLPDPLLERVERAAKLIRSAGWDGACALLTDTFVGAEADFLGLYLVWTEE